MADQWTGRGKQLLIWRDPILDMHSFALPDIDIKSSALLPVGPDLGIESSVTFGDASFPMPAASRVTKGGRKQPRGRVSSTAQYSRACAARRSAAAGHAGHASSQILTTQAQEGLVARLDTLRRSVDAIASLLPELRLEVVEHLDPTTFSAIYPEYRENRSVFKIHLRKLLHDSAFAQAWSKEGPNAYMAYLTVMTAYRCMARSLVDNSLLLDAGSQFEYMQVSPDYRTYFTLERDGLITNRVTLWSFGATQKAIIQCFPNVFKAEYIGNGDLAIQYQNDSISVWTAPRKLSFPTTARLSTRWTCRSSYQPVGMTHMSLTPDHFFQNQWSGGCFLMRHEDFVEREQIPLPMCMRHGYECELVFSPDGKSCVVFNGEGHICFLTLEKESPPHFLRRGSLEGKRPQRVLFSPNSQIIVATSFQIMSDYDFEVEIWSRSRLSDLPVVFESLHISRLGQRRLREVAFSADSRYLMLIRDGPTSGTLVVLRIFDDKLGQHHVRELGAISNSSICTFPNRWVFVGRRCLDMGEVFDCGI